MKICFAASSGGHLEELKCLESIINKYDGFIVTEKVDNVSLKTDKKIYFEKRINRREFMFPFRFISIFFHAIKIINREKPDAIITTGALMSYPFCLWCKIRHKKVIYIESFARIETASLTGKLVYKFADLFIIQWESLKEFYPNALLTGCIF